MRQKIRLVLFSLALAATIFPNIKAYAEPTPYHPVVVELFTSEGCASCPPAEKFLEKLSHDQSLIVVAYHVDYWDDQGWKDTYSLAASTFRQRQYLAMFKTDLFTPQMVIQGESAESGNQQKKVAALINKARNPSEWIEPKLEMKGNNINIHIDKREKEDLAIYMVSYEKHATVDVRRGENAGKTLEHINSVVDIKGVSLWKGEEFDFTTPKPKGDGAVLFVQNLQGKILGAATIDLQ